MEGTSNTYDSGESDFETIVKTSASVDKTLQTEDLQEMTSNIFDFGESDFETIVKTSAFVDKTLLIEDIFKGTSKVLITAPRRFGKSTNADMVKRFLEIEVGREGRPKNIKTTKNYKLFKNNNLEICKCEQFFNEHFGKHPVIYIDYKQLSRLNDFDSMLDDFKRIVVETFVLHRYLLNVENFWVDDLYITEFKRFVMERQTRYLGASDLKHAFKFLSKVLCRYFRRKVFVIIDEYDAYFDNLICESNPDMNKIISYIQSVNDNLLTSNRYVDHAFLTGVLRVSCSGLTDHGNNIISYYFLNNHPFCKYYGLTSEELVKLLNKLVNNEEVDEVKAIIDKYYKGYIIRNQNNQIYSMWSVFQYLNSREVQSYWCMPEYFSSFEQFFKIPEISEKMNQLLMGNPIDVNISKPLNKTDVLQLNNVITNGKIQSDATLDAFVVLLYHLGYLSISKGLGRGKVSLTIPNEEIKYEISNMLTKTVADIETDV